MFGFIATVATALATGTSAFVASTVPVVGPALAALTGGIGATAATASAAIGASSAAAATIGGLTTSAANAAVLEGCKAMTED